MKNKVLEVNVDDLGFGGVFSLVKNVIKYKTEDIVIDIASIEMFENQNNINELNELGTNVFYVGYNGNKILKQLVCIRNLKYLIKRKEYNCVHIHADVANKLLISGIAAKISGVKTIILHSHAAGVDGSHRKLKKFIHNVCRYLLKYIGTDFVACSNLAGNWMFPNIHSKNVVLINNGVDLDKFRFDLEKRKKIREEIGVKDEFVIGHVGRFAYQKNHEYLIDIFENIKNKMENVKLLLIGEGVLEQQIRRKVVEKSLEENIIFYGTSNRVQDLFQAMDIFVLPSHFEGLPIVGVEAQAAGLPVVFSNQITHEAKLTQEVEFLPIKEEDIKIWTNVIEKMLKMERKDNYKVLKQKRFSIQDTADNLLNLYERK